MYKQWLFKIIILSFASLGFLLSGCEDVLTEDEETAIVLVDSANILLEPTISEIFSMDADSVSQSLANYNFYTAHGLFVEAHNLDGGNDAASFGMALTALFIVSQDEQFGSLIHPYFQIEEPLLPDPIMNNIIGFGFGLPLSSNRVSQIINLFIESPLSSSRVEYNELEQLNMFHQHIENELTPFIETGLDVLAAIDDSTDISNFGMEFTQIDLRALRVSLRSLRGLFKAVTAYDMSLESYDSIGVADGMNQGGSFGTLNEAGIAQLNSAHEDISAALSEVLDVLDQYDIEASGVSPYFLTPGPNNNIDFRSKVAVAQSLIGETSSITYSSRYADDSNYVAGEVDLDISQYYSNPITDLKTLLPSHTISSRSYENMYLTDLVSYDQAAIDIDGLNNTFFSVDLSYTTDTGVPVVNMSVAIGYIGIIVDPANPDNLPAAFWELYDEFQLLISEYSDDLYQFPDINFQWTGYLTTGSSLTINGQFEIYYQQLIDDVILELEWEATTYTEWLSQWPDPSMNGIFPNVDAEGLAYILGYNENNWDAK